MVDAKNRRYVWRKECNHRWCHVTIVGDMKACGQNDVTIVGAM
jgi:hypothetical protein